MQHLQVLALVFVNALDQHVEHRMRIGDDPRAMCGERGKLAFVVLLDFAPAGAKFRILGKGLEQPQL